MVYNKLNKEKIVKLQLQRLTQKEFMVDYTVKF